MTVSSVKPIVGALVTAVLLVAVAADAEAREERPGLHPLTLKCDKFVAVRMSAPLIYRQVLGFAEGYLAAARDLADARTVPLREAEGYLFEYCYDHRSATLVAALGALIDKAGDGGAVSGARGGGPRRWNQAAAK
jgi:hypothetical protein